MPGLDLHIVSVSGPETELSLTLKLSFGNAFLLSDLSSLVSSLNLAEFSRSLTHSQFAVRHLLSNAESRFEFNQQDSGKRVCYQTCQVRNLRGKAAHNDRTTIIIVIICVPCKRRPTHTFKHQF